ncbi:MAG: hypothetical protein OJF47_000867 [Nitrospira sp.]|jgi:PAS domain-containing protein|nr:MAG: hypothetical protein OJF47_000867 [Nitrospira sp.]
MLCEPYGPLKSGLHKTLFLMERSVITMLSRTAAGVMLADEQGVVAFWNKSAERLLEFSKADVTGRLYHVVMRGKTLAGQLFCSPSCTVGHRLGRGGGVRNFGIQTRTKAGTHNRIEALAVAFHHHRPSS